MRFIEYYHRNGRKIRLVDKEKSWFMKAINWFLMLAGKLKLASIQDFMTRYVTTIGRSIYASPTWTLEYEERPRTVHELCHVEQWGLWYAITYVVSKKARMLAESTCVQAEMMCFPEKYSNDIDKINNRAKHFVPYGIPYEMSVEYLLERQREVLAGKPLRAAARIAELWSTWKNAEAGRV